MSIVEAVPQMKGEYRLKFGMFDFEPNVRFICHDTGISHGLGKGKQSEGLFHGSYNACGEGICEGGYGGGQGLDPDYFEENIL